VEPDAQIDASASPAQLTESHSGHEDHRHVEDPAVSVHERHRRENDRERATERFEERIAQAPGQHRQAPGLAEAIAVPGQRIDGTTALRAATGEQHDRVLLEDPLDGFIELAGNVVGAVYKTFR
jgi:hypothetical protein